MGFEQIPKKVEKNDEPDFQRLRGKYSDEAGERLVGFDKLDNPDDLKPEGRISAKEAIERLKKRVEKEKNASEN